MSAISLMQGLSGAGKSDKQQSGMDALNPRTTEEGSEVPEFGMVLSQQNGETRDEHVPKAGLSELTLSKSAQEPTQLPQQATDESETNDTFSILLTKFSDNETKRPEIKDMPVATAIAAGQQSDQSLALKPTQTVPTTPAISMHSAKQEQVVASQAQQLPLAAASTSLESAEFQGGKPTSNTGLHANTMTMTDERAPVSRNAATTSTGVNASTTEQPMAREAVQSSIIAGSHTMAAESEAANPAVLAPSGQKTKKMSAGPDATTPNPAAMTATQAQDRTSVPAALVPQDTVPKSRFSRDRDSDPELSRLRTNTPTFSPITAKTQPVEKLTVATPQTAELTANPLASTEEAEAAQDSKLEFSLQTGRSTLNPNTPSMAFGRVDIPRHLAQQLHEAIRAMPDRPVDISLSPEELGRVRLSISAGEAGVTLNILAERQETLDLMRRHADALMQELSDLGFTSIDLSFGQGTGTDDDDAAGNDANSKSTFLSLDETELVGGEAGIATHNGLDSTRALDKRI